MKKVLLSLFVFSITGSFAQTVAPVLTPSGGFHIDGNLQANSFTVGRGDWIPGPAGSGGYVLNSAGVPINASTTYHIVDPYGAGDDIFTGTFLYNDNPNICTWGTGAASNKSDLNNVLIHFAKDSIGCDKWIMFAADRESSSGVSYVDFEFLQNTLTRTGVTSGGFVSSGPASGRTVNDLLFTIEYTNAGGNANLFFYKWAQVSPGVYDWVMFTPPGGTAYGFTSSGGETVPYGAFGTTTYTANQYIEGAVDLDVVIDNILGNWNDSIVFKTLFVETKHSLSASTPLADFIAPIQLTNFSINCTVGINEINLANQVSIAPNPANDKLTVSINEQLSYKDAHVEIYSLTGEKVFEASIRDLKRETFDVSMLCPGFYSVRLVTDKGIAVKKMVKQ